MRRARIRAIVRQFPQNGIKLLLHDPRNVRDLLAIQGLPTLDLLDFDGMTVDPTTFVQRDYRHIEADVVLRIPLRQAGKRQRRLSVYILIEHQSEPDRLMILRMLEYVVHVYKAQVRTADRQESPGVASRLQPVLPLVFYTGRRSWPALGSFFDLVEGAELFRAVLPSLEPLYLNLATLPANQLESTGGFLGWVLRLVQERAARPAEFQDLLGRVVEHLEQMPANERVRWLELLSYVQALVYHERDPDEHEPLLREIETSVQSGEHQEEVRAMGRTIAEELVAKGRKEGRKEGRREGRQEGREQEAVETRRKTLLRQLRQKFRQLPSATTAVIDGTTSVDQLDTWLDRVVTAETLADVGIR